MDNPKCKKSWCRPGEPSTSTAKPNIHGAKFMLCIWDQLGVVYYELLQPNENHHWGMLPTIDAIEQNIEAKTASLREKARQSDFPACQRSHVAKSVKETLEAFNWDILSHPPYSLDFVPFDYHLFRSMTYGLSE